MAGSFGYEAEHYATSVAMAELSLMPAVRNADADTLIVADGTSCRHQIADGANRHALHVAQVLERALVSARCGHIASSSAHSAGGGGNRDGGVMSNATGAHTSPSP